MTAGERLHRLLYALFFERDLLTGRRVVGRLRRRHVAALGRHLSGRASGRLDAVAEVDARDADPALREHIRTRRPLVLKGAARDWRATATWSFDYFRARYGDERLYIANEEFERSAAALRYSIRFEPYSVAQFVDAVQRGSAVYLKFLPIFKRFPALLRDLDLQAFSRWSHAGDRTRVDNEFYMGGRGSVTHLHTERSEILHACIEGRKRWRLYTAENSLYLYPVPARTLFVASEVDFLSPDARAHPWFRCASGYETVLEKGDVLYLPAFCWHAVENLEPVISANYLWTSHWRSATALPLAWFNGAVLRTVGSGTLEQFEKNYGGRFLPNLHS